MRRKTSTPLARNGLIGALDVGTTKVVCFIARGEPDADGRPQVVGMGHHVSRGLRNGMVVDLEAAEASIRAAVEAAEQMAGANVESVVLGLSGGGLDSRLIGYELSIAGHQIGDGDLRRILDPARIEGETPAERRLIHAVPVGYSIDGARGVRDPRGMYGQRLGVNLHLVHAADGVVRNLVGAVNRCHLDVGGIAAAPLASGLACLVEDEKDLGVTLIDMGGGTTTFAVFFDGELVFADGIPVGGAHVTSDIARGLSTSLGEAERAKVLYGNAISSPADEREAIRLPLVGEESEGEINQISRATLNKIIQPRLEETLELVRGRLEEAGFDRVAGPRLVLTGGASQLPGMRELAGMVLDRQVRVARPLRLKGLAEAVSGPAFSLCAGLLQYAIRRNRGTEAAVFRPKEEPTGRLGRVGMWIRENF